jgi:hypothetical protein
MLVAIQICRPSYGRRGGRPSFGFVQDRLPPPLRRVGTGRTFLPSDRRVSPSPSPNPPPSAQPLRPSTGGFPDDLAHHQTLYAALPRSQYYAPSATLRPLPPQVVQSPRDGSQRFPRSHDCPLHSGLGRSWTPIRCSLHPRRGPYACTPLAGTVWPIGPLARSVRKPRYATTHAILISSQRVHASDALNGASSRSHTGIQAGGLRVWMRYCPIPANSLTAVEKSHFRHLVQKSITDPPPQPAKQCQ